jgi:glycosyltransferase involved in cell wall biosynthesis
MSRVPRIAVVLPVHNGEKYIREAIQSVLDQTFTDFELLVIDDGSTDNTLQIISGFVDLRLRVIPFASHRGLALALNTGMIESRSEFIARMDADDICMPRRFERQVLFLKNHPDISICGTWMREFGTVRAHSCPPTDAEHVRASLFFGWAMNHPTLMLRRSFLERFSLLYKDQFCEDLEFLITASQFTRLANIPECLIKYRRHNYQFSAVYRQQQRDALEKLLVRQLRVLVPEATDDEEQFHVDFVNASVPSSQLRQAGNWLHRLDSANREKRIYDIEYFRRALRQIWYRAHRMQAVSGGVDVLRSYWSSPFACLHDVGLYNQAIMAAKCMIGRPAPLPESV